VNIRGFSGEATMLISDIHGRIVTQQVIVLESTGTTASVSTTSIPTRHLLHSNYWYKWPAIGPTKTGCALKP
jgi:hypothetical protein